MWQQNISLSTRKSLEKRKRACVRCVPLTRIPCLRKYIIYIHTFMFCARFLRPEPNGASGCTLERDRPDGNTFRKHQVRGKGRLRRL